ncbi:MAG TPA: peptidylprolyl isomerase [Burkholderiales bacterium]|nr:peptidylprolyl isomerase [Burkholderiales bacterium]
MRAAAVLFALALAALPALAQRGALPQRSSAPQPLLVDRIVAVVGKDVVTLSELGERREFAERALRRQGTPLPERALLERQILERLILDKAQLQLARENGIRVEEIQLDRALERIAESNNTTLAGFRAQLDKEGIPFDKFRDEVRQQIQLQRLREREVDDRIEVSDGEIDLYLEETKAATGARTEYNLAHILVRLPDQASPEKIEQARARAEKARAEALAGGDFGKLAASYSDGPDGLQGGLLGWRPEERLPELFASALKAMKPGEVSPVLRSPGGFHVLKLLGQRGAGQSQDVEQAHVRHILVRTSEVVSEADARRRLTDLRERIVTGGADFAELARLHSQDASASKGGDLGWVLPGDTVPEFERAFVALKPGEVSQPIRTPFGYHLIQLLERRSAGLTPERRRMQARLALKERKADEAYQEWLRQLRDRTYVEVRLED